MTRKFKALGLALVAVFALSAVAASAASAHSFMSEGNVGNVTLHGTQETTNVFKAGSAEVICKKSTFHGTQATSPETTVTIHPVYTECEAFGFEATVDTEGCNYVFSGATNAESMGTVSVECEAGKEIRVTAPGCTLDIAGNTVNQNLNGVSYTNIGSGTTREVTVNATVTTGIHYVATGSPCALIGISQGTHTNGSYTGKVNVTGTVSGTHVGVTIE